MSVYIPLKKAAEAELSVVGLKAKLFASLEKTIKIPFTLIITSEVFDDFIKFNNLEENVAVFFEEDKAATSLVHDFARLSTAFQKGRFSAHSMKLLRECFELVCLDTGSINALLPAIKNKSIMSLRRSTSYEDGDSLCAGLLFTKDDFEEFLERLKSCYISAFAPSSVTFRRKNNITSFSMAVLLSKMPQTRTCFHIEHSKDNQTIFVESYVGFPDSSKSVERDKFTLNSSFLKIIDSNIKEQKTVVVFDLTTNKLEHKNYITKGSAQSAPDQALQEAGRIGKKIVSISGTTNSKATLIGDKNNNLYLLDLISTTKKEEKDEEEKEQIVSSNKQENKESESQISGPETQETNNLQTESLDINMKDFFADDKTIKFVENIILFLKAQKNSELASSIEVIIRSLENEVSAQTLTHALSLCKEIVERAS